MAVNSPTVALTEKKFVKEIRRETPNKMVLWWSNHWRALLGEMIATMLLIFLGCMTCIPFEGSPVVTPLYSPIGFGLIVLFVAQSFGHISGSHLNPVVTLGAVILEKMSLPLGIGYTIAQCIGAITGYGLLIGLSPIDVLAEGICTNQPHFRHSVYQTFGVELAFTASLMFIICALWDPVNEEKTETVSIKFGLTVSGLAIAGGPLAGVSMNPARSLGPAVWTGVWTSHWVYWVGPLLGGAITATLYKLIWLKKVNVKRTHVFTGTEDNNEV